MITTATSWDLIVLDPLFVVIGISILSFIVVRERTSLKWVLYFLSTFLFWFVSSIVVSMNAQQLNNAAINDVFSNPIWIMLFFLGSASLLSVFLKPLATWLTGKVHWRKWWILMALMGLILALTLSLVNQGLNSVFLYVVIALCLAVSLSSNSLYFLIFNEQFYYRIAPVLSTVLISIIISFATFFGSFLVNLEATIFPTGPKQYLVMSTIFAFLSLIAFGIMFTFFQDEDRTYVRSFELSQIKLLPKYSHKRLAYMLVAVLLLGIFFGLTQSNLVTDYIYALFMVETRNDELGSVAWVRAFNQLFIVPQFLFGYLIYKQFTLRFGFKPILISLLTFALLAILLICFFDNPYVYVIFNFMLGLAFSQVFYALFSMAIMWNYRSKNVPVTGFVASAVTVGSVLVELIIRLFKVNRVGIFKDFLPGPEPFPDAINFAEQAGPIVVIIFGIVGAFCIFAIVSLFFSFKYIFADYSSLNVASQNAKTMLKEHQREKARSRIFVNEVKIKE